MMPKMVCIWVCVISCAVPHGAFGQSPPSEAKQAAKIESLAKEYNSFDRKDWKRRRDFCIRLIDERIISDSTKTSDVRRIFAHDLSYHEATDKRPAGGCVLFERPLNQDPTVQQRAGWHFSFESSADGHLWSYYLTDFNK